LLRIGAMCWQQRSVCLISLLAILKGLTLSDIYIRSIEDPTGSAISSDGSWQVYPSRSVAMLTLPKGDLEFLRLREAETFQPKPKQEN
jgi:hypothetical protein